MKLTKKQLSALQRIVGREQTRYDEIQSEALAGVHPSEKHCSRACPLFGDCVTKWYQVRKRA